MTLSPNRDQHKELVERLRKAIAALRKPDASLARVPNTVRQSIADIVDGAKVLIGAQSDRIVALEAALIDVIRHVPTYYDDEDKHERVHAALDRARAALKYDEED